MKVFVNKEAPVNFLSDPLDERLTHRPTNIMVYEWIRGKHACVNLFKVSTLVATSNKVAKHVLTNNIPLHHLRLIFFCFLAPEIVDLLHRVQRIINITFLCVLDL